MDSFIDKLAQKFTAQEIIKANASAEAEELHRAREQVRQYEECLDEMKQVNDSTKVALEQFAEFNQTAREQLEQALLVGVERINEAQVPTEGINELVESSLAQIKSIQYDTDSMKEELEKSINDQIQDLKSQLMEQLDAQLSTIETSKEVTKAQFLAMRELAEKQISTTKSQGDAQLVSLKTQGDAQIAAMREQSAAQLAALREQAESQSGLKTLLEGQNEQFMDYVHKENVKVYRNVQASVVEELNKQTESLGMQVTALTAKTKTLMAFAAASFGVSAVSTIALVVIIMMLKGVI